MTIKKIELFGFKQFDRFSVGCRKTNVMVGPNNAGKSTVLDALRVVADVMRYSRRRRPGRRSFPELGVCAFYELPASSLSIPTANLSRNYSDDPAKIVVTLNCNAALHIELGSDTPILAYLFADGRLPTTTTAFRQNFDLDLVIVPTLGPFEAEEKYLADETVRTNENTRLAHRNFRNILFRKSEDEFAELAQLVEATWDGLTIERPERHGTPGMLSMMYVESRIPREIHWSGFGLQVWMQILLQMLRGGSGSVLVLDEPDIYLHADLQRRLLAIANERFGQVFLATHSTELINEANAGDVLQIRKGSRGAKRVSDERSYRELFEYLGSSENAEFARVARARRLVFFEGNDRKILRRFGSKLSNSSFLADTDTVFTQVGGFGQWRRVVDAEWTLQELFDIKTKIVALFDRDYRCDQEVQNFLTATNTGGIVCRVLTRKEIENYCLHEETLINLIQGKALNKGVELDEGEIISLIDQTLELQKVDTQAALHGAALEFERKSPSGRSDTTISKEQIETFSALWTNRDDRLKIVSGKSFLSRLNKSLQSDYGFSITVFQLIDKLPTSQIPEDLQAIISEFEAHLAA